MTTRKSLSEETKRKIGIANSRALKGRKLPEEVKDKIRIASIGRKHPPRSAEWLRKQRLTKIGKKKGPPSEETRRKISAALLKSGHRPPVQKGKDCHFWRGGITPVNEAIRKSLKYREWREKVFKRDNYTCQTCERKSGDGKKLVLHADHIKPFALFPDLRFDINNGRTLCQECHRKTDTFGSKTKTK